MKNAKKQKILIVEDEKALSFVLAEKFHREGFFVWEAEDGLEGLEKASKHHPDLIILDIVMPSMDGLTMLKKLRENKWGENVPVLILSNLSDPAQINEANNRGVIDYLVKSNWGLDDVVEKVKETLKISNYK
jgi:DNA-binding response OmpR family regulator